MIFLKIEKFSHRSDKYPITGDENRFEKLYAEMSSPRADWPPLNFFKYFSADGMMIAKSDDIS